MFTVLTVPSAFLMPTATLSVFSVPLVAGASTTALVWLLEPLVVLELPDVVLEAARAVCAIIVHNVTLRIIAKTFFFTSVTSLSKSANSDLSKQAPKTLF
jgi:hypothetical protein